MAGKTRIRANKIIEDTLEDKDGDTLIQVEESDDEDKIRFDTAGTQRMIIDETGQVGVGTNSPEEQFHIHGSNATLRLGNGVNSGEHSPKIQLSEMADSNGDMAYGFSVGYNGSTNNFELKRYSGNTAGNDVLIASRNSGDIGIKTTSPEADLHIYGGNSGQTFSNVTFAAENAGSSDSFYVFQTATAGGGKSFSITNGGKVGIGTTSPTSKLHIESTSTDDLLFLETTEDSNSASPVIKLKRNSSSPANADYLGQLKFQGENDADQNVTYSKITGKIGSVTDGSEQGIIEFANMKNGSSTITARLKHDALQLVNSTNLTVDGNIGIGNNSPNDALDVTGNVRVSNYIRLNCQNTVDPAGTPPLLNHAHIYSKLTNGVAEIFVQDSSSNVTQISPHNSEGEWHYFSRNTRTGKVVRVNMEKMIRRLEEITGESFMEEWYEDID